MIERRSLLGRAAWLLLLVHAGPALAGPVADKTSGPAPASTAVEVQTELTTGNGHRFPVTIFSPSRSGCFPVIIFSAGAFSSPDRYLNMLQPIAEAGYVILAPTHLDAEILALDPKPKSETVWKTRNAELAYLATVPESLVTLLDRHKIKMNKTRMALLGHSYGALIAQLGAGAVATEPDGTRPNRKIPGVDALIAFSPPGPVSKVIDSDGWSSIDVPSLTVTGTADILPGFIDDWRLHKAGYAATPKGTRWLWVGEEVDHYFDGLFGRAGSQRPIIAARFDHAIATTINFLDIHLKSAEAAEHPAPLAGVEVTRD
ncbi:hypothetical protein [Parasphingorhabdus sp.]|uniref:alpha/beta hydrolase family protein n=1 Tax=Parasphingorhabdus sp. TaxID=2709688 RepID=UPI0032633CFD